MEKSASADTHINQLRMEIESRLRIALPEDISASLADGVILCHVANHVRPRAVPSIHVPSPSVVNIVLKKDGPKKRPKQFSLGNNEINIDVFLLPAQTQYGQMSTERGELFIGLSKNWC